MIILALDTTGEEGGVGIFRDAECLALAPNRGKANQYSITLFELVEQALAEAQLQLGDIELYAAANGPGSFTGIRVGLAAAMAWARAFERPVIGVSVLEAMLYKAQPASAWTFPIMDAGRGEFYVASFRRSPSESQQDTPESFESADQGWLFKPESLRAFIAERVSENAGAVCIVRANDRSAVDFQASLPPLIAPLRVEGILVDAIAAIALKQAQSSNSAKSAKLDAYYLRRPDAEMNWKE